MTLRLTRPLLAVLGGLLVAPAAGAASLESVCEATGLPNGTARRLLSQLVGAGWVVSSTITVEAGRTGGGVPRRLYALTPTGRRAAEVLVTAARRRRRGLPPR